MNNSYSDNTINCERPQYRKRSIIETVISRLLDKTATWTHSPGTYTNYLYTGPLRDILLGGTKTNTGPDGLETCFVCLHSNQNRPMDKTATILRFRNRLIAMVTTDLH